MVRRLLLLEGCDEALAYEVVSSGSRLSLVEDRSLRTADNARTVLEKVHPQKAVSLLFGDCLYQTIAIRDVALHWLLFYLRQTSFG